MGSLESVLLHYHRHCKFLVALWLWVLLYLQVSTSVFSGFSRLYKCQIELSFTGFAGFFAPDHNTCTFSLEYLLFEFRALEVALEAACIFLDTQVRNFRILGTSYRYYQEKDTQEDVVVAERSPHVLG